MSEVTFTKMAAEVTAVTTMTAEAMSGGRSDEGYNSYESDSKFAKHV